MKSALGMAAAMVAALGVVGCGKGSIEVVSQEMTTANAQGESGDFLHLRVKSSAYFSTSLTGPHEPGQGYATGERSEKGRPTDVYLRVDELPEGTHTIKVGTYGTTFRKSVETTISFERKPSLRLEHTMRHESGREKDIACAFAVGGRKGSLDVNPVGDEKGLRVWRNGVPDDARVTVNGAVLAESTSSVPFLPFIGDLTVDDIKKGRAYDLDASITFADGVTVARRGHCGDSAAKGNPIVFTASLLHALLKPGKVPGFDAVAREKPQAVLAVYTRMTDARMVGAPATKIKDADWVAVVATGEAYKMFCGTYDRTVSINGDYGSMGSVSISRSVNKVDVTAYNPRTGKRKASRTFYAKAEACPQSFSGSGPDDLNPDPKDIEAYLEGLVAVKGS